MIKKSLNKSSIKGMCFNIIQIIYEKPTGNILIGEKLKAFLVRQRTRQGYSFTLFLFNMAQEVLTRGVRQEKEIKGN